MDVLRPTGSQPARVYWVRRAVVLVVLVAAVILVYLGFRAVLGGGDDPTDDPQVPPTATDTESTTPTEADAGTPVCDPASLGVVLAADATTYPSGAQPTFTVSLTNNGSVACLIDAGETQRQVLITSGSDRIWASTDCASADPLQLLLAPEQTDERQVQWDRNRSVEGCVTGQAAALPGTYQAVLTLAGVSSPPVVFGLE